MSALSCTRQLGALSGGGVGGGGGGGGLAFAVRNQRGAEDCAYAQVRSSMSLMSALTDTGKVIGT